MFAIPSIGLGEGFILAGCAGLPLLIGVIVLAVILTKRKKGDTPANGSGVKTTKLRYALLAIIFLIAFGVFLILDLFDSVSVYLRFTAAYAAFWVLVGALLLHGSPLRRQVLTLSLFAIAVLLVPFINWNSRKPFLRDLYRIEEGMTEAQVQQIMGRYIKDADLPSCLLSEASETPGRSLRHCVFYRHTDESWGNSDWGVVAFENGRVAQTEFLPGFFLSRRSTPPGADTAGSKLEQAGYVFLHWKEGLAIMIWHDALESGEGSGSGSTADPIYRYQGYAVSPEGHRFEWEAQTADGKTARFQINNTSYDLADGALFLITTEDGQTEVQQLQRDLSSIQPNHESIVAFARGDPDAARFTGVTPDSQ
jgi:hypothetical protein